MSFVFNSRRLPTPASMKGFVSRSFHQNSRLTRRQSGSVENGSTRGSTFESRCSTEGSGGLSLSLANKFSSVRDFRNWSCLFCKDLVISVQPLLSHGHSKDRIPTEMVSEIHATLDVFPDAFADNPVFEFCVSFFHRVWGRCSRSYGRIDGSSGFTVHALNDRVRRLVFIRAGARVVR